MSFVASSSYSAFAGGMLPFVASSSGTRFTLFSHMRMVGAGTVTFNTGQVVTGIADEDTVAAIPPAATSATLATVTTIQLGKVESEMLAFEVDVVESEAHLPLTGGSLTGPLVLSGPPTIPLHATTKSYVDDEIAAAVAADAEPYLPLSGGTVTGDMTFTGRKSIFTGGGLGPAGGAPGLSYFTNYGVLQAFSPDGTNAGIFQTRSSNQPDALGGAAIGVSSGAVSDKPVGAGITRSGGAWAYYGAAQRRSMADDYSTLVFEGNIANQDVLVATNSYYAGPHGVTATLWVATGGEITQLYPDGTYNPVSAAIAIVTTDPNSDSLAGTGSVFNRGIVFADNAISGTDGVTGGGIAISMAKGHSIHWDYDLTGARAAGIRSNATSAGATIVFQNGAMTLEDTSSHLGYTFNMPFNPDNKFYFTPSSGATFPIIGVESSLADAGMNFRTQGVLGFSFRTGGGIQFEVRDIADATTRLLIAGGTAAARPYIGVYSLTTSQQIGIRPKGSGGLVVENDNGIMFAVIDGQPVGTPETAYLRITTPTAAGAMNIGMTAGTGTNVPLNIFTLGTGQIAFATTAGTTTQARVMHVATAAVSVDLYGAASGGSPAVRASAGNLFLGQSGLATDAIAGFIQIPTCNGPPTGVPTNAAAGATMVYDVTNNRLYAYTASAWRSVALAP